MSRLEIFRVALRYTFAWGRGYLSTFLSTLSMLGLILAIGLLITVLSVMNGFDKEMRERILGMVPHITVYSHLPINDWREPAAQIELHRGVLSVTPFAQFDALFMRGTAIESARGIGLDIDLEARRGKTLAVLGEENIARFHAMPDGLVLGAALAKKLHAAPGDSLTLIVPATGPQQNAAPARLQQVTLAAVLDTGTELDEHAALVNLSLARELLPEEADASGLRVTVRDIFSVSRTGWELLNRLSSAYYASNWMMTHGNLYAAIQLSRNLVSILLFSIIAVAAFNVVSSLVLVVFDKRSDIAILRTLGTHPGTIGSIFVLQGAMIGLVGVIGGSALGILGSLSVGHLVAALENLLQFRFLNTDVYPVSFLPSDLLWSDVVLVAGIAFVMCILAAIYPALRAARLAPATILNQS